MFEIQRMPTGMFSTGKTRPASKNTSRNPNRETACIADACSGMAAPAMVPNAATQNIYKTVAMRNGVGSPAKPRPKYPKRRSMSTNHWRRPMTMEARIFPSRNSCAEMLDT